MPLELVRVRLPRPARRLAIPSEVGVKAPGRSPYPKPTTPAVSAVMRGNRRADTKPEILVRSALHRAGLRFRKDYLISAGERRVRVDIAFPSKRVAVFVDGCFWHGCPEHGNEPKANTEYWLPKLARNRQRDLANTQMLRWAGWVVVRLWEHVPPSVAATRVEAVVRDIFE